MKLQKIFRPFNKLTTLATFTLATISQLPHTQASAKPDYQPDHPIVFHENTSEHKKRKGTSKAFGTNNINFVSQPRQIKQLQTALTDANLSEKLLQRHTQLESEFQSVKLKLLQLRDAIATIELEQAKKNVEVKFLKTKAGIKDNVLGQIRLNAAYLGLDNFAPIFFPNDYADKCVQLLKEYHVHLKVLKQRSLSFTEAYHNILRQNSELLSSFQLSNKTLANLTQIDLSCCFSKLAQITKEQQLTQNSVSKIYAQLSLPGWQIELLSYLHKFNKSAKLFKLSSRGHVYEELARFKQKLKYFTSVTQQLQQNIKEHQRQSTKYVGYLREINDLLKLRSN